MFTWQHLVERYNEGIFAIGEIRWRIFTVLDENNVGQFLTTGPAEIVKMVIADLEHSPVSDEEWRKTKIGSLGSGWTQADTDRVIPLWRRGVEAMRNYLRDTSSSPNGTFTR